MKLCKGTGKAKGMGCLAPLPYSIYNGIKKYQQRYGLGYECKCFNKWLYDTPDGQDEIVKASQKAGMKIAQAQKKDQTKAKKERKWELMSTTQKIQAARKVFQRWIVKVRDKDEPCISCGNPNADEYHGGHYKKAELYSGIIFNEQNCHKQCVKCNTYLGGNEAQYRIALCLMYGELEVVKLEEIANNMKTYRWSDSELKEIINKYKKWKI